MSSSFAHNGTIWQKNMTVIIVDNNNDDDTALFAQYSPANTNPWQRPTRLPTGRENCLLHMFLISPLSLYLFLSLDPYTYMTPRLKSLVLWERPAVSGGVLASSLALVLSCRWVSLLNVACALLVLAISSSFVYVNGLLVFNRITGKPDAPRPLEYASLFVLLLPILIPTSRFVI